MRSITYKVRIRKFLWRKTYRVTGHQLDKTGPVPVLTLQLANGRQRVIARPSLDFELIPIFVAAPAAETRQTLHEELRQRATAPAPRPTLRRPAPPPPQPVDLVEDLDELADAAELPPEGVAANLEDEEAPPVMPASMPPPQVAQQPRGRLEMAARSAAQQRINDMVAGRVRA